MSNLPEFQYKVHYNENCDVLTKLKDSNGEMAGVVVKLVNYDNLGTVRLAAGMMCNSTFYGYDIVVEERFSKSKKIKKSVKKSRYPVEKKKSFIN